MPGSPAHLVARFFDVAFARALTGSERAAVAAWLDPEQAAVFFSQSDADQRHGYEAALHLIADGVDSVEILQAGLLHDIGIILLDQHHHDGFRRVILGLGSESTLPANEQRILGWDHTDLGHRVGTQWRLPRAALDAIRFHHAPKAAFGEHAPIVHCVALANLLVSLKGLSSVGIALIGLEQASLDVLKLTRDDLKVFADDFDREFVANRQLFEIQKG